MVIVGLSMMVCVAYVYNINVSIPIRDNCSSPCIASTMIHFSTSVSPFRSPGTVKTTHPRGRSRRCKLGKDGSLPVYQAYSISVLFDDTKILVASSSLCILGKNHYGFGAVPGDSADYTVPEADTLAIY